MGEQSENNRGDRPRQDDHPNLIKGYWQPGRSGNPNGRPSNENSITYWLKQMLGEPNGGGAPAAKNIAKKLLQKGKAGQLDAIKEIMDRTEGKPKQNTELTDNDGGENVNLFLRVLEQSTAALWDAELPIGNEDDE
jgi:hypothetical protein